MIKGLPSDLYKVARRKLGFPEDAVELKGKRSGQHSIRISDQWRVCFRWENGNALNVEVLKEEFLDPMGITPYALAKAILVDPPRIDAIIKGRRKITTDTAIRLSKFFGTTPGFWTNLQSRYELETLMEEKGAEFGEIRQHHIAS